MTRVQKVSIVHDPDGFAVVMDALGRAVIATATAAVYLVWWAVLFPMVSVPFLASGAAGWVYGWPVGLLVAGVSTAGMVLWRVSSPQTFERWFTGRVRSRWLSWFRYRRRWAKVMNACGLTLLDGERVLVPRLVSVHIGQTLDTLRVRMLIGHSPDLWEKQVVRLAHAFDCTHATARLIGAGLFAITFHRTDFADEPVVVDFPNRPDSSADKNAA
ncbi:hypothetical protein [Nocardia sp. AG03]|uniref:hypothetical protein n=1 Tax=Nocardia sp. AG03 TaxID=3025312 RepID=UPI0024183334|nr:hypothetical protein [Nocardia sp. AG03]